MGYFNKAMLVASAALCFNLSTFAQDISLKINNVTVKEAMEQLKKTSGYSFVFSSNDINTKQRVSVSAEDATIEEVVKQILKGQTGIDYEIQGNKIILKKKSSSSTSQQKSGKVTGRVLDAKGEPIIGATIMEKGTSNGTITDFDGNFILEVFQNAMLEVSYVGYQSQELKAVFGKNLGITLSEDTELLDEVVVVGYGTQKKVNLTGAVSSVKMDEVLGSRPIVSVSQALESAIPGLQISSSSGKPGAGINMNIRGVTSINNSDAKPLILVDNIPMDLEMVDPNDIESVSVLKDASASAIYGARAAYGVILVETKKGKKNSKINMIYSNNFSFSSPASLPKKVSPLRTVQTYEDLGIISYFGGQDISKWLNYLDEYQNGKYPEGYVIDNGIRYNLAETDAFDNMMETGFQQQHNISMSGGSESAYYRASFGMVNQDGILYSDKDTYKRYNVNAFMSLDINKWLTGQIDYKYSKSSGTTPNNVGNTFWQYSYNYQPMAPLGYGYDNNVESTELLPYLSPRNMLLNYPAKQLSKKNTRVLGRLILKPIKDLIITGEFSYNEEGGASSYTSITKKMITPTHNMANKPELTKSYYETENFSSYTNSFNLFATYNKNIEEHHLKLMVGFNQESYHYEKLYGKRDDIIDSNLPSLSLSSGTQYVDDEFNEYALRSGFYRLNYDYKDKYLFEFSGRYDGSSRFIDNNRFGFFPSFSAGWRISEETFMSSIKYIFDNIKLRISWGQIGNQDVAYYGYLPIMSANKVDWILPEQTDYVLSMTRPSLVSTNYTWEKVETTNIGLDFGLLNNRLSGTAEYYIRETKDMLAPTTAAPSVLGDSFPNANSANLKTKGWEITLQWRDKISSDWSYNIGLNLYDYKSKITKYDNSQGIILNNGDLVYRKDMEFGEIWGYETDRFYTSYDFDENGNLLPELPKVQGIVKPNPGDILYKDQNNDGLINNGSNTLDNPGDLKLIGNNSARYQYNINGGVTWKSLDLSFIISGVGKRDLVMPGYWAPEGTFVEAVFDWQTDYWTESNMDSYWPRIYGNGGNNSANNKVQTKYIQDGSYVRIKNITLSYNFPKKICQKLFIQSLKAYVNGENIFTWHHLPKGYYPDMYTARPGTLSLTSGIQSDGAGSWSYPLMRQISFGINVVF